MYCRKILQKGEHELKTIVIGAVNSTKTLIEEMLRLDIPVNMVFSLDDAVSKDVSGYYPLHEYAANNGIPYKKYTRINDEENIAAMRQIEPDYIFAIGFSQLVSKKIMEIPRYGVIGMHPAPLPEFRGRAVIVWQILERVRHSKITLFRIDEGADSGYIIDQEPFEIGEEDYAEDVLAKTHTASIALFRRALPKLVDGTAVFKEQDHTLATYCLRRTPEDGIIDWEASKEDIYRFIRAISHPYPGAYSYYDGKSKVIIWRAHVGENKKYYGFPGQIAEIDGKKMVIVLKDGLLYVDEYESSDGKKMFSGHRFGGLK